LGKLDETTNLHFQLGDVAVPGYFNNLTTLEITAPENLRILCTRILLYRNGHGFKFGLTHNELMKRKWMQIPGGLILAQPY
jgi:hypothetical protein